MSDQVGGGPSIEAGRYVRVLRRRWAVVLVLALLGLALAEAYLFLKPRQATASALVTVSAISSEPFNTTRQPSTLIDPQTELQTARSSAVVSRTAAALAGDPTDADVRQALKVTLFTNATVLRISFTAGSAREAIEGADEAARQFLAYRGELAADKLDTITEQLTKRRDLLRGDLLRVNQQLSKTRAGSGAAVQAESDRQLLNIELDSLATQINSANGIDTSGGTVLTTAADSGAYFAPRRALVLGSGLLAGLVLGLVAAFARNAVDRRVHDEDDVSSAGVGPVLARLRARDERLPPAADDLDALRGGWQRLLPALPEGSAVLSVLDLGAPDAPSTVPAALALDLARTGRTAELVLMEHPTQLVRSLARHLHLATMEDSGLVQRFRSSRYPGLVVSHVARSAESDPAEQLRQLVGQARGSTGTTVVALASNASRAARLAAGRLGDAVVLVAGDHASRTDVLQGLADELRAVGANIAGAILVPAGHRLAEPTEQAGPGAPGSPSAPSTDGSGAATLSPPVGRR